MLNCKLIEFKLIDDTENIEVNLEDNTEEIQVNLTDYNDTEIKKEIQELDNKKVDKIDGKGLSTNDYTNQDKEKLDSLHNYDDTEIRQDISNLENNKANRSEIPDVSEFISKDVNNLTNYTKTQDMNTAIDNAVGAESTNRQNADIDLQSQIDAITVSSDVVDIVSTYQDLLDYDTSRLTQDDVIKVLQDSTHNNALSYYRWVNNAWEYLGSEGPFYTKGETDALLQDKVGFTDYPSFNKTGVIKAGYYLAVESGTGKPYAEVLSYNNYNNGGNNIFIGKGTLENVIAGKGLVNNTSKFIVKEYPTFNDFPDMLINYSYNTSFDYSWRTTRRLLYVSRW